MTYKTYSFGELVEKWVDNRGKTPPLSDSGIPLLEIKHLPERGIYPYVVDTKFVDQTTYESWFRAYLEPEDVLFSTVGTTARVMMTPSEEVIAIAQNILGIRFKKNIVDPWFMFYYMRARQFQHDIESRLVITVQASIKRSDMTGIPVDVPAISIQQAIVKKVFSLDLKIDLNHQINQTLEQMAQAIFKSWFVDFEPVKAKIAALEAGGSEDDALLAAMQAIAGSALFSTDAADADAQTQLARLQTEHPEQYATLRATAELFPAAMQDSELGEIPEGWSVNKIEDLIQRISVGKRYSQKTVFESGSIPVLDQGKSGIIGYHNDEPGLKASEDDPVIVFANHTCYMRLVMHDFSAIQNVLPFKGKELNIHWIYLATLGKQKFTEYKGHWPDFVIKDVVTPNNIIASHFGSIVKNLFITQFHNEQQSASLSNIRDTLLPKLLSGELSVSAAADQINKAEEAVNVQS